MEKLPSNRRKAIDELERGRNFANQLRRLINGDRDGSSAISAGTPSVQDLLQKVQTSFFNSLLLLSNQTSESHLEVSPVQPNDSSCWINPAKSEDSQESCKSSTIKDRRGSYKRRRTSETREIESETPTEDGYQWRKYGQKVILNAQYPRNYYRCTHKFDQFCQATKQVQKVREQPSLYKITYYGHHICRNLEMNPEIILDSGCASDSSMFLSFDKSLPTPTKQDCPFLSSFPSTSSVKKECKEEIPSSSSNDYLLSSELTFDNNSPRYVTLSSTLEPDHKDVNSGDLYDFAELEDFDPFVEL